MWLFWEHFAKKFKILPGFELFSSYLSLGRSVLGKFFWECRSYWDQTFFLLQKSMKMLSYFHFWGFICKNCQDFAQIRTLFIIAQARKVHSRPIFPRVQILWRPNFFPLAEKHENAFLFSFLRFNLQEIVKISPRSNLFLIISQPRKVRSGQKKIECRCDWDQSFPLAAKHENAFLVSFLRFELFPSLYQRNKRTQKQQIMHCNGLT